MAMASSTSTISFPLTDLKQLMLVADEYLVQIFIENLTSVFEYQTNNINEILSTKKFQVLKNLREVLLDNAATDITELQGKTPKALGKKSKSGIIDDIITLGKVLTRCMTHTALDSLFQSENSTSHEQDQVDVLKSEIDILKKENEALKSENNELKIMLSNCQLALGISSETLKQSEPSEQGESNNDQIPNVVPLRAVPPKSTPAPVKSAKPDTPEITHALIRNIDPACSRMSILNHFKEKLNMDISLSDIFELPNKKCDKRDFKVSVPANKLTHVLSNWPEGVSAEPYVKRQIMNRPKSYKNMSTYRGNRWNFRDYSPKSRYNSSPRPQSNYYHNSFRDYSFY